MEYVDIESFRSKYSDITVTAVPNRSQAQDEAQPVETDAKAEIPKAQEPRVEITRVPGGSAASSSSSMNLRSKQQPNAAAFAYANEYKEVMAKLEYTKYMHAKVQLMTLADCNPGGGAPGMESGLQGMMSSHLSVDPSANIVEKYSDLLKLLAEMKILLPPSIMGTRMSRDTLQRDIAQARVMVRECLLILARDQQQEAEATESTPTSD
ncbi:hypothetical protein KR018_008085 [Drosophila ironensis]|nr:hypothetical protein KR018_008085 [Drosophila ironensis]